jgi:hypothetical protein
MTTVRAHGSWQIVGTKTGKVLVDNLTINKEYKIDVPLDQELVRRVIAETTLRTFMVERFVQMLRDDRELYLKIGGTQWSVEIVSIEYHFR